MEDKIVIEPHPGLKLFNIIVFISVLGYGGYGLISNNIAEIVIAILLGLYYVIGTNSVRFTLYMDKNGCTISLNKVKKTYLWSDFAVITYEEYNVPKPFKEALIFSLKPLKKNPNQSANKFCMFKNIHRCFYVYLREENDSTQSTLISYDKRILLSHLNEWGVKIANCHTIYELQEQKYYRQIDATTSVRQGIRENEWIIQTELNEYVITFVPRKFLRRSRLFINQQEIHFKREDKVFLIGFDYKATFDRRIFHLVNQIGIFDIAYNGEYVKRAGKGIYGNLKQIWKCIFQMVICLIAYIHVNFVVQSPRVVASIGDEGVAMFLRFMTIGLGIPCLIIIIIISGKMRKIEEEAKKENNHLLNDSPKD